MIYNSNLIIHLKFLQTMKKNDYEILPIIDRLLKLEKKGAVKPLFTG